MSIESLYPYAGNHAVQNAIFVVEWTEPLKSELMLGVNKLAAKYKNLGLSHVQHQQLLEFKLEALQQGAPQSAPNHSSQPTLGGIVFACPANVGEITRSITITRQNCMIAVPNYTRWDEVFSDVQEYLKVALDYIAPHRPLSAMGLQYNDIFSWKDDPAELDLNQVFVRDGFLPANAFHQRGIWHSHHGYLEHHDLPVPHGRLENVNVDMLEPSGERTIQIVGSHRATFDDPIWQSHLKNKHVLADMFAILHRANKTMLRKLLTEQVCAKISLTSE